MFMLGLASFGVGPAARAVRFAPETGQEEAEAAECPFLEWYTGRPAEHALSMLVGCLARGELHDELVMLCGCAGGVVPDDILVIARHTTTNLIISIV